MKLADLSGQKFGKLTVINEAEPLNNRRRWNCQCECGQQRAVLQQNLINGNSKSCGCGIKGRPQEGANLVDMTGQTVGRLTVICQAGTKGNNALWLCRCSCGNEKLVDRPQLRSGNTRSCGCLYKESRRRPKATYKCHLEAGEAAKNNLLKGYRHAAAHRSLEWALSREEFFGLIRQPCYYCGIVPSRMRKVSRNGHVLWNGIDRIDNAVGYLPSNVVACCHTCNHAKCDMSQDEFLDWLHRIALHLRMT